MQDLVVPNKIIKTKRKSISLIIKNNGEFIVRAPLHTADAKIYAFIKEKEQWIIKKRGEILQKQPNALTFLQPEKISILGETYDIVLDKISNIKVVGDKIIVPEQNSKDKLIKYLKKLAKDYLIVRAVQLADLHNFSFSTLSISSAKTCWGSCNYKNKINFTYKLMLCPKEVVDYIIMHELCHTKIKNHSKQFWNMMQQVYPNYKQCEKWLKQNRGVIEII